MSVCYNKERKSYFISYKVKKEDGTWKTISIYKPTWTKEIGKRYMLAIEKEEIEQDKKARKLYCNSENENEMNLVKLCSSYIQDQYLRVKESTVLSKKYMINKYILSTLSPTKSLDKVLTIASIDSFKFSITKKKSKYSGEPLTVKYIGKVYCLFRDLLDYASTREYISFELSEKLKKILRPTNTASTLKLDTSKQQELDFWEEDDINKFFSVFKEDDVWYYLFLTEYICALRIGELLGLYWSNFSPVQKKIYIRYSVYNNGKLSTPKTSDSEASIAIPQSLCDKLLKLKDMMKATDDEPMFFAGGRVSKHNVRCHLDKYIALAGVRRITPHGLRHSCATTMLHNGCTMQQVSKHLRHSSIEVTMNTYAHLYSNEMDSKIESVFGGDI